jgi:hypothetical protein
MIMRLMRSVLFLAAVSSLVWGCQSKEQPSNDQAGAGRPEPDYVTVQHILIGFQGSVPGKNVTRSRESARELAEKVFEMAKSGTDFGELVKEFTDDAYPGVYRMANFGVPADRSQKIFPRDGMVQAFGDVGFPLEVGGIGMAEYDPQKSKYGWHIIKRIE